MRLVNSCNGDVAARVIAGEIAGEHRYLQSEAANSIIDALRLVCGRPEHAYDGRNDWMRRIGPKLEAIFD